MKDFQSTSSNQKSSSSFRIALLVSRYHEPITAALAKGAENFLTTRGHTTVWSWVSGAYELPQGAQILASSKKYDGIVALGCLLKGETAHFEFISNAVATGLDAVGRNTAVPVSFGVLTVDTLEQARERAGGQFGNKGEEAALATLELLQLKKGL